MSLLDFKAVLLRRRCYGVRLLERVSRPSDDVTNFVRHAHINLDVPAVATWWKAGFDDYVKLFTACPRLVPLQNLSSASRQVEKLCVCLPHAVASILRVIALTGHNFGVEPRATFDLLCWACMRSVTSCGFVPLMRVTKAFRVCPQAN